MVPLDFNSYLGCAMAIKFWSYYVCVRVGKGENFLIQIIEGGMLSSQSLYGSMTNELS